MINCIAIDDEPLALTQLTGYISRVPFLNLVASCQDAFDAMSVLSAQKIDLMFVDINMPDLNGMDFVRSLTEKPLVIFTTAYSEYAVEGFKVDALDYLLKPFGFQDFLKAVDKAYKWWEFRTKGHGTVSPPASRITGADSPVMALSSMEASPSTISPSAGIVSPASQIK